MKINHNLSAITANNQLLKTDDHLANVMERLSSGLSINHAKDNPAGMAISHKMQTQIDGLNRATDNASDGQAVIEIADGALGEVTEMLQRMRELCVQAANETNCDEDKAAIQCEIAELKEEINRVSEDTEYNTMKLLDGSKNSRVYSGQVGRLSVSRYVDEGFYKFQIDKAAKQAVYPAAPAANISTATNPYDGESGTVAINGYFVNIDKGDTTEQIYEKLRNGAEKGECEISGFNSGLQLTSKAYGKDAEIKVSVSNADIEAYLGMVSTGGAIPHGEDAEVTLNQPAAATGDPTVYTEFTNKATVKYEGNHITISDAGGFEMSFYAYDEVNKKALGGDGTAGNEYACRIEVTDIGNMTLQIGANQHQTLNVEIPSITCEMMYIDDLDCTTVTGADRGIAALDKAINYVSTARARLGAYENRLDHTIADLQASSENMTKALSNLSDADMAEEMVDYTTYNVLSQAGVSVLSQANDMPQTVLQLLG